LLAASAAAAEGRAEAQGSLAEESAVAGGAQVYEPAFFAVYRPVTARDMVEQVPGFSIDDGADVRGFGGAAGNVLIDGERPSSKGALSEELARIPAASVLRIELIRGGAGDLDVRGQAIVVNVVLADGIAADRSTYEAELGLSQGDRVSWYGRWTRSVDLGDLEGAIDLEVPNEVERGLTGERRIDPGGDLLELRDEFVQDDTRQISVGATARWTPTARDALSANAKISPWRFHGYEQSVVTDAAGTLVRVDEIDSEETDAWSGELGADWERRFSDRLSMKLVGLATQESSRLAESETSYGPAGFDEATFIDSNTDFGERVGRATLTWRRDAAHTFELGLEAAQNVLDQDLRVSVDDGSGPHEVPLPVASTRVEEIRGEAYVTDVWTASPRLAVEGGLTVELSRISQSGGAVQEREFAYPKPRLIATYALHGDDQLRLSVVREVAQLDFGEFASAVSLSDGSVTVGNKDLEPARTWAIWAEWERRFGERGALTLSGFHDRVESVQDIVVIDLLDENGDLVRFSGPGNLGDGTRSGVSVAATAPLDRLGLANGVLRLDATLQDTRVRDPLTGRRRSFSYESDWWWRVDVRQDLPGLGAAWGFDYGESGDWTAYRADEEQTFNEGRGNLDMFVETTRWGGVTLRLGVDNLFDATETTERRFFEDLRGSSPLEAIEFRERSFGPYYSIRVSGTL
jgi:hypothetical protein